MPKDSHVIDSKKAVARIKWIQGIGGLIVILIMVLIVSLLILAIVTIWRGILG